MTGIPREGRDAAGGAVTCPARAGEVCRARVKGCSRCVTRDVPPGLFRNWQPSFADRMLRSCWLQRDGVDPAPVPRHWRLNSNINALRFIISVAQAKMSQILDIKTSKPTTNKQRKEVKSRQAPLLFTNKHTVVESEVACCFSRGDFSPPCSSNVLSFHIDRLRSS